MPQPPPVTTAESVLPIAIEIPPAYAKVNLALSVLGKLDSGLHALQSLVCPISLADSISLTLFPEEPEVRSCRVSFCEDLRRHYEASVLVGAVASDLVESLQGPGNLAARAVEAFLSKFCLESSLGYEISISKSIPFQAGLGGGSADAAAILKGLAAWKGQGETSAQLILLAGTLGADVPALMFNQLVVVEGTGRLVCPVAASRGVGDLFGAEIVLIKPTRGVGTAEAFKSLGLKAAQFPDAYFQEQAEAVERLLVEPEPRFLAVWRRIFPDIELPILRDPQAKALTYQDWEGRCLSPGEPSRESATRADSSCFGFFNDFEPVVAASESEVALAIELLVASGGCEDVVLSGSGSAVVGLVKTNPSAKFCIQQMIQNLPEGWFGQWAKLLP